MPTDDGVSLDGWMAGSMARLDGRLDGRLDDASMAPRWLDAGAQLHSSFPQVILPLAALAAYCLTLKHCFFNKKDSPLTFGYSRIEVRFETIQQAQCRCCMNPAPRARHGRARP